MAVVQHAVDHHHGRHRRHLLLAAAAAAAALARAGCAAGGVSAFPKGCALAASAEAESACAVLTAMNLARDVQLAALSDPSKTLARINDEGDAFGTAGGTAGGTGASGGTFYAFVYDFDGECRADAGDARRVGRALALNLGVVSTPDLGRKFAAAAMSGGDWVSFPAGAGWAAAAGAALDCAGGGGGSREAMCAKTYWHRAWVLAFPGLGSNVPLAGPAGLIASTNKVPTDNDLKTTWASAYPPAWAVTSGTAAVDKRQAYYVGVGYKERVAACPPGGGADKKFHVCQQEAAFNLVHHVATQLNAAFTVEAFAQQLGSLLTMDHNDYTVTMGSIATGKSVDGGSDINSIFSDPNLHTKLTAAANTARGRWVMVGAEDKSTYAFVRKITPPPPPAASGAGAGDDAPTFEATGYYVFASFTDPEHTLLTHSTLDYGYCAANSRTGCSVTTAQNLAFEALDELDSKAREASASSANNDSNATISVGDVWARVNTDTVSPGLLTTKAEYADPANWQGYLQRPNGFYVFAYGAENAGIVAQGAIPVAATCCGPRNTYQIQRALNMVTHPRLRELFLGNALHARGQWVTYQWSNKRVDGAPAPRKRTFTVPWKDPTKTADSAYEYYLGVGYDDVHPDNMAAPCYASSFSRCSEEHSFNLAHIVQTDLFRLGNGETLTLADKTTIGTLAELFTAIHDNTFYKVRPHTTVYAA
jgi:hypothetical protein